MAASPRLPRCLNKLTGKAHHPMELRELRGPRPRGTFLIANTLTAVTEGPRPQGHKGPKVIRREKTQKTERWSVNVEYPGLHFRGIF